MILQPLKDKLWTIPPWRRYLYAVLAVCGVAYLAWSLWGERPIPPGAIVIAKTAPAIVSMPVKRVPIKVQVVKDKPAAIKKLGLPDDSNIIEELQTAVTVPANKYGATSAVFINRSTGQTRTVIKTNEAPWFRLERNNRVGVEVGAGSSGNYQHIDYQRDIFSIKGVIIAGKARVTHTATDTDARIGVRAEYNW